MPTPEHLPEPDPVPAVRLHTDLPDVDLPDIDLPDANAPDAEAGPYVDQADWLASGGRVDLIDEIADAHERPSHTVQPSQPTLPGQSGRESFWSRATPGWPNESPGWPSRAAS